MPVFYKCVCDYIFTSYSDVSDAMLKDAVFINQCFHLEYVS